MRGTICQVGIGSFRRRLPVRRWAFRTCLVIVVLGASEAAARVGQRILERRGVPYSPVFARALPTYARDRIERNLASRGGYFTFDPYTGWTIAAGSTLGPYCADDLARRDIGAQAGDGPSIAAFGDSFTHGDGVAGSETWTAMLATNGRFVANYGVSGFGVDQAFLRYREREGGLRADVVIIGMMSENVCRHVSSFRPFYTLDHLAYGKPRFELSGDGLVLVPNPLARREDYERLLSEPAVVLPRLGEHDQFYATRPHHRRYDAVAILRFFKTVWAARQAHSPGNRILDGRGCYTESSTAFAVTARILDVFASLVRARGATPIVVLFPTLEDVRRRMTTGVSTYGPLASWLDEHGVEYVDVLPDLCHDDPARFYRWDGHFSVAGNAVVAAALETRLRGIAVRAR
ncbi:MAG: SGNH/GDSL hydrolase family protein [Acidobacteriota bacterium]